MHCVSPTALILLTVAGCARVEILPFALLDDHGRDALSETDRIIIGNDYGTQRIWHESTNAEEISVMVKAIQDCRVRHRGDWPQEWTDAELPSRLRTYSPKRLQCRFFVDGELRKAWNFHVTGPRTLQWTFRSSIKHREIPESREHVFAGELTPTQKAFLLKLHTLGHPPEEILPEGSAGRSPNPRTGTKTIKLSGPPQR